MIFSHDDTELAAAFAVVRQYDPDTYARMQAANDWHVSTDPFSDLFVFDFTMTLLQMGQVAFESDGVTLPLNAGDVHPAMTWINRTMVGLESDSEHVSAVMATAETLVHEFAHVYVKGHNEPEAFRAGIVFASLLPGRDGEIIQRDNRKTLALITAHPEVYPNVLSD